MSARGCSSVGEDRAPLALVALLIAGLLTAGLAACQPRVVEEVTCTSDIECVRVYQASVRRLRSCLGERDRSYVTPGGPAPPECDSLQADSERWGNAVKRLRRAQRQEAIEDAGEGYEVPRAPPESGHQ